MAVIIDSSGSMTTNDKPRYTVQLSQIISDLLAQGDHLTVVKMPVNRPSCSQGPDSSLALPLDIADRVGFKRALDEAIRYDDGTHFAAPVRTAIEALGMDSRRRRMLLIIADSGGFGQCGPGLSQELARLRASGAMVAAINIGSSTGAFEHDPAFDFRTPATDSRQLIRAVAEVYQRFLGARRVQTGDVSGEVRVQIGPYVRGAFLVVAADGPVGPLQQTSGNPGADEVDLNYLGGGRTLGLDGVERCYRMVRLSRARAGSWGFTATGLNASAGWMLLEDYAVGVRMISPVSVPAGAPARVALEVFDEQTGRRITDTSALRDLRVEITADGVDVSLRDEGGGVFSGAHSFQSGGKKRLDALLRTDVVERKFQFEAEVLDVDWRLEPLTPPRAPVGLPLQMRVRVEPVSRRSGAPPPEYVEMDAGDGGHLRLNDQGVEGDERAGDGVYGGVWTPARIGHHELRYTVPPRARATPASAGIEIAGYVRFGVPRPIAVGPLRGRSEGRSSVDLSATEVGGSVDVQVATRFHSRRMALEVETERGWQLLGDRPLALHLEAGGRRMWPVRLRVGDCPAACGPNEAYQLDLQSVNAAGVPERVVVPLRVEVLQDPWLHCWWPVLAVIGALLVGAFVSYGYWSPSRFAPQVGVMLSPEEDMTEGFFHPIRGERGSGIGLYRDARFYIHSDFRLSPRSRNALAKLRADGQNIQLTPTAGHALFRLTTDGDWQQLQVEEAVARPGALYRDEGRTIFFEIRNRAV